MLRPACLLPATQLSLLHELLTPRSGREISLHYLGPATRRTDAYRNGTLTRWRNAASETPSILRTGFQVFRVTAHHVRELSTGAREPVRFGAFDATLVTLARVPSTMQYTYFKDLALVPFVLVPRIIFPIKPVSVTQQQYSVRVYGMVSGGSAAPFIIGEGYLNGGALGVPILTCAWGIMWAIFYRGFLVPRRKELVAIALYAALLTRFATSFEWALMSMIGLPSFLVVWAPAIYWCTLSGKKQIGNRGSLESITNSP